MGGSQAKAQKAKPERASSGVSGGGGDDSGGPKVEAFLEHYALGKVLGQGAFGIVYACKKRGNNTKEYAVKMVDKVGTPPDEIEREAKMLERLAHKNVVKLHKVYYEQQFVCMVMDIYKGGNLVEGQLTHWENKGKIPIDKILNIARQMFGGIAFLHSQGVVHRDVKGDNVLMDRKDISDEKCQIVLSDFGNVVDIKPGERLREKCGTRAYWPPEVYSLSYDSKVDIWAGGVITYGMVVGRFPFKGGFECREKQVRPPRWCPKGATDFILKCLDKNENTRLSGAMVMAHPWIKSHAMESDLRGAIPSDIKPDIQEVGAKAGISERWIWRKELASQLFVAPSMPAMFKDKAYDMVDNRRECTSKSRAR